MRTSSVNRRKRADDRVLGVDRQAVSAYAHVWHHVPCRLPAARRPRRGGEGALPARALLAPLPIAALAPPPCHARAALATPRCNNKSNVRKGSHQIFPYFFCKYLENPETNIRISFKDH